MDSSRSGHKKKTVSKIFAGKTVTVNDLRDRLMNGETLSRDERTALDNFDRYRMNELENQPDDQSFHNKYIQLQVMANLSPYDDFLKSPFSDFTSS